MMLQKQFIKLAVIALLLCIGLECEYTKLNKEQLIQANQQMDKLCQPDVGQNSFMLIDGLLDLVGTLAFSRNSSEDKNVELKKISVAATQNLEITKILYENVKFFTELKVSLQKFNEVETNPSKKATLKLKKPMSIHSSEFYHGLYRNYVVLLINQLIEEVNREQQKIASSLKSKPVINPYKLVIEGLDLFSKEHSASKYDFEHFEFWLIKLNERIIYDENLKKDLINELNVTINSKYLEYKLESYICDLYDNILTLFKHYLDTDIGDDSYTGNIQKYINVFGFIPFLKQDVSGPGAKFSVCSEKHLKMDIQTYFREEILKITTIMNKKDVDPAYPLNILYDYSSEDGIDFWDMDEVHEEIEYLFIFDYHFIFRFTKFVNDEKVIANHNIRIEDLSEYRIIHQKFDKISFHYDINFYKILSKYYQIYLKEFENTKDIDQELYEGFIIDTFKLIYKFYNILRHTNEIKSGDSVKVVLEKIMYLIINEKYNLIEGFELYYSDIEELENNIALSYVYLIRIYLTEFYGLKDMKDFDTILEKNKATFTFYNIKVFTTIIETYFSFDNLQNFTRIWTVEITIFKIFIQKIKSMQIVPLLMEAEVYIEKEIKTGWKKNQSKSSNRKLISHLQYDSKKGNEDKLINSKLQVQDIREIFKYFISMNFKDVKIPMKRMVSENIQLQDKKIKTELQIEINSEYRVMFYQILYTNIQYFEYFYKFMHWLKQYKFMKVNRYLSETPQFQTILNLDVYYVYSECFELYQNKDYQYLNNGVVDPQRISKGFTDFFTSSDSFEQQKMGEIIQKRSENLDLLIFDNYEKVMFLVKLMPIFKHFRITDEESLRQYNEEIREVFRDIYYFVIRMRIDLLIIDENAFETLFDSIEECLEVTFYGHYGKETETEDEKCIFSYQRFSELYWFLKYFQLEDNGDVNKFFDIYSNEARKEFEKKNDNDLSLEEKKTFYPTFKDLDSFPVFLSYILDNHKITNAKKLSQSDYENVQKSKVIEACEERINGGKIDVDMCNVLITILSIEPELNKGDGGVAYELIIKGIEKKLFTKFSIWYVYDVLQMMAKVKGTDFYRNLNTSHDQFFSYLYVSKEKAGIHDQIFQIEKAEMPEYVKYLKVKFKASPEFIMENILVYEVVQEILKRKGEVLNELLFINEENRKQTVKIAIGIFTPLFLIFADKDENFKYLGNELIDVTDFVSRLDVAVSLTIIYELELKMKRKFNMDDKIELLRKELVNRQEAKIMNHNQEFGKAELRKEVEESPIAFKRKIKVKGEKVVKNAKVEVKGVVNIPSVPDTNFAVINVQLKTSQAIINVDNKENFKKNIKAQLRSTMTEVSKDKNMSHQNVYNSSQDLNGGSVTIFKEFKSVRLNAQSTEELELDMNNSDVISRATNAIAFKNMREGQRTSFVEMKSNYHIANEDNLDLQLSSMRKSYTESRVIGSITTTRLETTTTVNRVKKKKII